MKKELFQEIEIPKEIETNLREDTISIKGPEGEVTRTFNFGELEVKKEGNKIIIGNKKASKREKKLMNSITAHLKNMLAGVQNKFEYKLKVCFSHFPINVEIQENIATIKNFLGEKIARKMILPKGVQVEVKKQDITIISPDKEAAGQAAANFERVTRIVGKDRRVFQDGIFITHKCGREM